MIQEQSRTELVPYSAKAEFLALVLEDYTEC